MKLFTANKNMVKIILAVLIGILAIGIIIGGIATYNNSKKELIPSSAFDFAAMTSYQDYIGLMTLLMYDAEKVDKSNDHIFDVYYIKDKACMNALLKKYHAEWF